MLDMAIVGEGAAADRQIEILRRAGDSGRLALHKFTPSLITRIALSSSHSAVSRIRRMTFANLISKSPRSAGAIFKQSAIGMFSKTSCPAGVRNSSKRASNNLK